MESQQYRKPAIDGQITDDIASAQATWVITGVAGFIGSHLLETLLKLNQNVVGLDSFVTGHAANLDQVRSALGSEPWQRFRFIEGDIRSLADCRAACAGAHYVLHQAGLGSVQRSLVDPIATNASNVDGFLNMLSAAKDARVRRFVYAASSAAYGNHQQHSLGEEESVRPLSPYAVTKLVNELYADVFAQAYGFASIGLRYFNVFGPRQDASGDYAAVIPKWVAAMIAGSSAVIHGDGSATRDYCFVANVVQANLRAAMVSSQSATNQIYNVAVGESTSLNRLFEMIRQILLPHVPELEHYRPSYQEATAEAIVHSRANIDKASRLLLYQPTYRLHEGLLETVPWYRLQL